jgi:hypothetical protein
MQNSVWFVSSIAVLKPPQAMTPAAAPPISNKPVANLGLGDQNHFHALRIHIVGLLFRRVSNLMSD